MDGIPNSLVDRLLRRKGGKWLVLAWHLAKRETANRYRWSKIGSFWPAVSFVIYAVSVSIVFSTIFRQELRSYLPFLTSGLAIWIFVQSFLVEGVNLYTTYKGYIVNVRIPFFTYALVMMFRALIILGLQLPVVIVAKIVFGDPFMPGWLYLVPALALTTSAGLLMAGIFSYLGPVLPDLAHVIPSITTILTLVTPILYPVELLSAFPLLYKLNPMYYLVSLPREALLGSAPSWNLWLGVVVIIICLLPIYWYLNRSVGRKVVPLL